VEAFVGHAVPGGRSAIDSTNEVATLARAWLPRSIEASRFFVLNQWASCGHASTVWRQWLQGLSGQRGLNALVEGLLQNGPAGGFERGGFEREQRLGRFGGFPGTRHSGEELATRSAGDALSDFDREFVQQLQELAEVSRHRLRIPRKGRL